MLAAALRGLTVLMLVVFALLPAGCQGQARSTFPGPALAPSQPSGNLQEVAPPGAVRQLQQRLAGRQPRVNILSPANGGLLPNGPWALTVAVEDWPLVDAGPLGIGPHLVVQLDGEPPIRVESGSSPLNVPMAPLAPGSHRLTVYAAFPWGEAVKAPGASQQIRLQRVAPNPLALPAEGTPQLVPVQAVRASADQPALVDWLLVDAPLQHLRDGDDSWRLRVTVNGDSFLLDRQAPLWLRGLHNGSNAVVLELLDQAGQPLNPPFNSAVQELVLASAPPMGWQLGSLSEDDLQRLLGVAATPSSLESPQPAPPLPASTANADDSDPAEPAEAKAKQSSPSPVSESEGEVPAATAGQSPLEITPSKPPAPAEAATLPSPPDEALPAALIPQPGSPSTTPLAPTEGSSPMDPSAQPSDPATPPTSTASGPETIDGQEQRSAPASLHPDPGATAPAARDQVNADGSLIRPKGEGMVGRLRAKFGR